MGKSLPTPSGKIAGRLEPPKPASRPARLPSSPPIRPSSPLTEPRERPRGRTPAQRASARPGGTGGDPQPTAEPAPPQAGAISARDVLMQDPPVPSRRDPAAPCRTALSRPHQGALAERPPRAPGARVFRALARMRVGRPVAGRARPTGRRPGGAHQSESSKAVTRAPSRPRIRTAPIPPGPQTTGQHPAGHVRHTARLRLATSRRHAGAAASSSMSRRGERVRRARAEALRTQANSGPHTRRTPHSAREEALRTQAGSGPRIRRTPRHQGVRCEQRGRSGAPQRPLRQPRPPIDVPAVERTRLG